MMQGLVGLIIGVLISSGAWWFILNTFKKKEENSKKERDEIMRSVGALLAELDSLITSYSEKSSSSSHYSSKLEAINKLLKTNLHLLDIYYVKYIELLLKYYNYRAEKIGLLTSTQKPISEIEMETSFSFIEGEEEVPLTKEVSEIEKTEEFSPYEKTIPIKKESEKTEDKEAKVDTFNKIEEFTFEKVEELSKSEDTVKEIENISEKKSEELLETLTIVEKEEEGTQEGEEVDIFEKKEEKDEEKTKLIKRETLISENKPEDSTTLEEKLEEVKEEGDVYLNLGTTKKDTVSEEEFALETLIDVEASSILSTTTKSLPEEKDKTITPEKTSILEPSFTEANKSSSLLSSSSEENMEVVIASDVKHIRKSGETTEKSYEVEKENIESKKSSLTSEETISKKGIFEKEIKGVEEEFVLEVNPPSKDKTEESIIPSTITPSSLKEDTSTSFTEEMITGEDIVSKIDSWNVAVSPTIKKEVKEEKSLKESEKEKTTTSLERGKEISFNQRGISKEEPPKDMKNDTEGEITGDDIVDKIDSFFGLIK